MMEFNHHPHAQKKGFNEHFLEFLMILLSLMSVLFAERFPNRYKKGKRE
jgi:hypothetical protein